MLLSLIIGSFGNIPSYTTEVNKPDYKVQTTYWNVENKDWKTDNSDVFMI
jgi:hypothetical protein